MTLHEGTQIHLKDGYRMIRETPPESRKSPGSKRIKDKLGGAALLVRP